MPQANKPLAIGEVFTSSEGRLTFPFLIRKQKPMKETDRPRYRATLVFPPDGDLEAVNTAFQSILEAAGWGESTPSNFMPCFHDISPEAVERYGYPEGGKILKAWNYRKVRFFEPWSSQDDPNAPEEISYPVGTVQDEEESLVAFNERFYPGCYVKIAMNFFAWKVPTGSGISSHIHAIQFKRDCPEEERFLAQVSAPTGFDVVARPTASMPREIG